MGSNLNVEKWPNVYFGSTCIYRIYGPSQIKVNTSVKYHYCMPICQRIWSCGVETVQKFFKSKFDLLTQNQQRSSSGQGQHMCEVASLCVKWKELLYRNHFFTDGETYGQTDSHGETRIPPQLRWRGYTN